MRTYKTITNLLRASGAYQADKSTMLITAVLHSKDRSFSRSWQRVQVFYLLGTHQRRANSLVFVRSHAYQSLCLKERRCVTFYSTDAFLVTNTKLQHVVVRGGMWWYVVVEQRQWIVLRLALHKSYPFLCSLPCVSFGYKQVGRNTCLARKGYNTLN